MSVKNRLVKFTIKKKSEFEGRKFHWIKFSGKIVLQKWFFQKKTYVYLSW